MSYYVVVGTDPWFSLPNPKKETAISVFQKIIIINNIFGKPKTEPAVSG